MDPILNSLRSLGQGQATNMLLANNGDPACLRPYIAEDGRSYVALNVNGELTPVPVNNDATLRKDEWIQFDEAVIRAAKPRLRAWGDLASIGTYNIPNGMGKTVLQYQAQSDISVASISMDGLAETNRDRPLYDLNSLPLPIIHKDFSFSLREIMTSRNMNTPLDTAMAELAGRRVAEEVEKLVLGVSSTYTYGGGTIYGYTNFGDRNTRTLTSPTASGWTPARTVAEVLQMKNQSQLDYYYGPWILYCSPSWDPYMDDDYSLAKGDNTLRQRLGMIEGITSVTTSDYLTNYDLVLVQRTPDVARGVVGMNMTTVQWETNGGMMLHFKVMCIMVPQIRADYNNNCGIVHGSV